MPDADTTAVPDDLPSLTADDLQRLWDRATRMVGGSRSPLTGEGGRLTWEEVRWWDSLSTEDAVRLVREVRHLREVLAAVIVALWDEVSRDDILADLDERHGFDIGWAHDTRGERHAD